MNRIDVGQARHRLAKYCASIETPEAPRFSTSMKYWSGLTQKIVPFSRLKREPVGDSNVILTHARA